MPTWSPSWSGGGFGAIGRPSYGTYTRAPGARTSTAPAPRPSRSTPGRVRPGAGVATRKRPSRLSPGRALLGRDMFDRNVFHRVPSCSIGTALHRDRAPHEPARSDHGSIRLPARATPPVPAPSGQPRRARCPPSVALSGPPAGHRSPRPAAWRLLGLDRFPMGSIPHRAGGSSRTWARG
jgi:hypothetical protein